MPTKSLSVNRFKYLLNDEASETTSQSSLEAALVSFITLADRGPGFRGIISRLVHRRGERYYQ